MVLNQVLVRLDGDDGVTEWVIDRVHEEGTCWVSGSTFRGQAVMRVSVVAWQTTAEDIDQSAEAILDALAAARVTHAGAKR